MGADEDQRLQTCSVMVCPRVWPLVVCLIALLAPAVVFAGDESPMRQKAEEPAIERLERLERLREMRGRLLREGVQLDEQAALAVEQVLETYDREQRSARADVRDARELLRELVTQDGADDAAYSEAIERLRESHEVMHRIKERRFDALMGVLSPKMTARLLVMLGKIHHERRRHRDRRPAKTR